jgi:hypothetical protein
MATNTLFSREQPAFGPKSIKAMSTALEDVCSSLGIGSNMTAKEVIAIRIIELARRGERSPTKLRDHLLAEASGGTRC